MTDTASEVMALARLLDAAARLDWSMRRPGMMGAAFDTFLACLSDASGVPRAELDRMSADEVRRVMDRVAFGDGYADMLDVAANAWEGGDET